MNWLTALGTLLLLTLNGILTAAEPPRQSDVLIYGATPAGVAAAVHAAREGMRVVLAEETGHVGGLVSGGLSNTDFRTFESLGGFFREFMHRVEQHYIDAHGADSQQVIDCQKGGYYEPRVARQVLEALMAETGNVTVLLHHRLDQVAVTPETKRLTGATLVDLQSKEPVRVDAAVLIDATYEGDLLADAGVPYAVGCEGKDAYGESLAFDEPNDWVQTYNFRATLTRDPDNRLPIEKPADYDRGDYELLAEAFKSGKVMSWANPDPAPVLKVRPIANLKADFNDDANCPVSLSLKNVNHPWPEGSPETRAAIYQRYKDYSLGLFWFLGHDPDVPEAVREQMLQWGLPKDEYVDTDHWSPALYVREGRRMIGEKVFTEHDTQNPSDSVRAPVRRDAVAMGDYSLNCHGVYSPAPGVNVGRIGKSTRPFGVPYSVMLPKEHDGLLVPVAVSSSHVGFSALRMEPVWIGLGQAAGVAAAMAVREQIDVREVDILKLQLRLHELGAMTVYVSDLAQESTTITRPAWDPPGTYDVRLIAWPPASPYFRAVQLFGTYGFFHHLVDPEQASGERQGRATGQWRLAFADHQVQPDQPIDAALAAQWRRLAQQQFDLQLDQAPELEVDGKLTRGEFLNRLLIAVTDHVSAAEAVTIAGNGEKASSGDGGPAVEAAVGEPYGLEIGPDGALYVCEIASHVIRRIDLASGIISTVVGCGERGYDGDGGAATEAKLDEPYEVRFDSDGHMYFVEMKNAVVRRVDAHSGIITTVAGTGEEGFSGDGGPATEAKLKQPHSIALDQDGNLYICDIGNHRVRRVDLKTGIISTFAGTGGREPTPDGAPLEGTPLNGPRALDFDDQHSLVLALREGNSLYRIDLQTRTLHHLAGTGQKGYTGDGGDARQAALSGPKGVAIAPGGDIYFADTESHTVRVVRASSGIVQTVVGDGKRGDGPDGEPLKCRLNRPHGVCVDDEGNVYIGDSETYRVRLLRTE